MRYFGFTLLRNGVKYDYSFLESLESLSGVVEKTYLALGDSEDTTEQVLKDSGLPIEIIPSVWDPKIMREQGVILSVQTNIALEALKSDFHEESDWGIYLQADEVIHEEDYELFKEDIKKAQESGCDAVRFRYLHFWKTHHHIAINKKWYPQEIRAVKLNSSIESWGDAQGFKNFTKVYESEARIYHYGHVRQPDKYAVKKKEFLELYHEADKIKKYRNREKRYDKMTECLFYFGTHPEVMKQRIENLGDPFEIDWVDKLWIVGDKTMFSPKLIDSIKAKKITWVEKTRDLPKLKRSKVVIINPSWVDKVYYKTFVPVKMKSKLARPWSPDFMLILKLSEKHIGFRKI